MEEPGGLHGVHGVSKSWTRLSDFTHSLSYVIYPWLLVKTSSLVAQSLKRLSGMQEIRLQSLDWEDPLEKEMATHSNTLAWRIPWREEPGRLQSMGSQRVGHD